MKRTAYAAWHADRSYVGLLHIRLTKYVNAHGLGRIAMKKKTDAAYQRY